MKSILSRKIDSLKQQFTLHLLSMPENIKPNFSSLARQTGLDRHTVARAYKKFTLGTLENKTNRKRKSKFDPYQDEIKAKLEDPHIRIMSVFKYMQYKYGQEVFSSYNSFKSYVRSRQLIDENRRLEKAHPRFETEYGEQVQLDWIENLKMELKSGEKITFNLFTAVFGASRLTVHIYSRTKTMEDFIRCLIRLIEMTGGVPQEFITDNMSAVVSITKDGRHKHPPILQLEKDIDTRIRLLPPRDPRKKGKNESSNRYQNWYLPYQKELETEEDLIALTSQITRQINEEASRTTGFIRNLLFQKEKEYLRPLAHPIMLTTYLKDVYTQTVPSTLLVQYRGCGYSVPKKFINKRVKLFPIENELHIYHNSELIAHHQITKQKINYTQDHYTQALWDHYSSGKADKNVKESIEQQTAKNLKLLGRWKSGSIETEGEE